MRHRWRVIRCVLFTILLGASTAHAQNDQVAELGVVFWRPSPDVVLRCCLSGNNVDFVQEFGIEDKSFPQFDVALGRTHKFRASVVTFSYDAETTLTRRIVLNARAFNIGVPATADIKWNLYKFGYEWDFISRERGFFGLIADLNYNKVEAMIESL